MTMPAAKREHRLVINAIQLAERIINAEDDDVIFFVDDYRQKSEWEEPSDACCAVLTSRWSKGTKDIMIYGPGNRFIDYKALMDLRREHDYVTPYDLANYLRGILNERLHVNQVTVID